MGLSGNSPPYSSTHPRHWRSEYGERGRRSEALNYPTPYLPLVSREWKNGSNRSYSSTPFLHSLLTKGRLKQHTVQQQPEIWQQEKQRIKTATKPQSRNPGPQMVKQSEYLKAFLCLDSNDSRVPFGRCIEYSVLASFGYSRKKPRTLNA